VAIDEACRRPGADTLAVLARRVPPAGCRPRSWRSMPEDPRSYGRELYAALRELDAAGAGRILMERVPDGDEWAAVADRLTRAARRDPPEAT
jgi:L-threonylcarbamoyladenylate synthase